MASASALDLTTSRRDDLPLGLGGGPGGGGGGAPPYIFFVLMHVWSSAPASEYAVWDPDRGAPMSEAVGRREAVMESVRRREGVRWEGRPSPALKSWSLAGGGCSVWWAAGGSRALMTRSAVSRPSFRLPYFRYDNRCCGTRGRGGAARDEPCSVVRGGGGFGMTPGCVAVCIGRRPWASHHFPPLPFP